MGTTTSPGAKKQSSRTVTLYDFIKDNHDEILARTSQRVASRSPAASLQQVERGLPLFLTQVSETLRLETSEKPFPTSAIGDVCQAITELALDQKAPITVKEFHTLNRCLDAAIAEAVTEHARLTALRD
jgi:hypothetical protein